MTLTVPHDNIDIAPDRPDDRPDDRPAAVIYTRISRDRDGDGDGVERQEQECRAEAERLGFRVVAVYSDNDISAFSGRRRPGYEAMCADLDRAGGPQRVLCRHVDRLYRRPIELEGWIDLVEKRGVLMHVTHGGEIALNTSGGRAQLRYMGVGARLESEIKSERLKSKHAQSRSRGWDQGGRVPFGWRRVPSPTGERAALEVHPLQAELIRTGIEHILAGGTLREIARRWDASGCPPCRRESWTPESVRQILARRRNAGLLVHLETEFSPATGKKVRVETIVGPGTWPPIPGITPEHIDEVRRIHAERSAEWFRAERTMRWQRSGGRSLHLLSRIATCGVCGALIGTGVNHSRNPARPGVRVYRCAGTRVRVSGCVTRPEEPVDTFVCSTVAKKLNRHGAKLLALIAPERDAETIRGLQAQIERCQLKLKDLAHAWRAGSALMAAFAAEGEAVERDKEAAEQRLAGLVRHSAAATLLRASERPGDAFLAAPVDVQRCVLRELVDITILPVGKGNRRGFDRSKIAISWDRIGLTV